MGMAYCPIRAHSWLPSKVVGREKGTTPGRDAEIVRQVHASRDKQGLFRQTSTADPVFTFLGSSAPLSLPLSTYPASS